MNDFAQPLVRVATVWLPLLRRQVALDHRAPPGQEDVPLRHGLQSLAFDRRQRFPE